jgi:Xaa-Pro aminopeptidase
MAKKTTSKRSRTEPFAPRARRLRKSFDDVGIDALLVTNPRDISYLSGFRGEDAYLLVGRGKPVLFSDSRFEEELEALKPRVRVVIRRGPMNPVVKDVVEAAKIDSLGVQAEHMTVSVRSGLARVIGKRRLRDTRGLVSRLRIIKDEHEVKWLRRAIRIQQDALKATIATVEVGQTEQEIDARLVYEMSSRGAGGASFPSIVAAQANGSLPHAVPGRTRVKANRPLLVDWGAKFEGYCGDLTRTFAVGRFPKRVTEIYDIVLEAQLAGIAAIRPGVRGVDVDAASRKIIEDAGYGKQFGHGLGHGIGLDVHEAPSLSTRSGDTLEPGMVVTVEPGIYLPGIGGVRIEDDVLVTERGHRVLSNYPKDRDSMVI